MSQLLQKVLSLIESRNVLHYKKVRETQERFGQDYFDRAEQFLKHYNNLLANNNHDLEYAVECYFKMLDDFMYAQVDFLRTGKYMNTSFDEVNKAFYNNPEKAEYYMQGLLLSQFLWFHHYSIFSYFITQLGKYNLKGGIYLEIGGGHGLYIRNAINILTEFKEFDLIDISQTSIDLAKKINDSDKINYITGDVFDFHPEREYNFISMCEVLEHVEDPLALLQKLNTLLSKDGLAYITTPTNAPTIDHIYLFNNTTEIVELINRAGFKVLTQIEVPAENVSVEKAHQNKICVMYGAFITSK